MKKIAIIKYHGATDTKGSRVSVDFGFFKAFISYDHEYNNTYEMIIAHSEEIYKKYRTTEKKKRNGHIRDIIFKEPVYINALDCYGIEYEFDYK